MQGRERLGQVIESAGLSARASTLVKLFQDSIRWVPDPGAGRVGRSRLGGQPDLPAGAQWPVWQDGPLAFIGQLALGDLKLMDPTGFFPTDGLLSFFFDPALTDPGTDPAHSGAVRVLHTPPQGPALAPRPTPEGTPRFRPTPIRPVRHMTLPPFDHPSIEVLKLDDSELDAYDALQLALLSLRIPGSVPVPASPVHRTLGHPEQLQENMQNVCQLTEAGLYCGDGSGYDDPRAAELIRKASEWQLLLQVDSDREGTGMRFAEDDGRLFYWIRRDALRNSRFDSVRGIVQVF